MKVGVVGNPRYGDLRGVLEHLARAAPQRLATLASHDPIFGGDRSATPAIREKAFRRRSSPCSGSHGEA